MLELKPSGDEEDERGLVNKMKSANGEEEEERLVTDNILLITVSFNPAEESLLRQQMTRHKVLTSGTSDLSAEIR